MEMKLELVAIPVTDVDRARDGIADNMKPGSIKGLQMVVKDAHAAHDELKKRGVDISDIDTQAWGKFVHFNDPDGNTWTLQELPPRSQFKV